MLISKMTNSNGNPLFMGRAIELAEIARDIGEVPVGSVVVKENKIIGEGYNSCIRLSDPSAHAEMIALKNAAKFQRNYRLVDCDLYVTIEPCLMCYGPMIHARIKNLFFGADEPKAGVVKSNPILIDKINLNHKIKFSDGMMRERCACLMQKFFHARRKTKKML